MKIKINEKDLEAFLKNSCSILPKLWFDNEK